MPEPTTQSVVTSKIDAIVLAGTQGTRQFEINGRVIGKPYLTLGGEPLVLRVTRAVLASKRIGQVFVVGDSELLARALEPLRTGAFDRLQVVQEGNDILDNCYRAFFLHLLPAHGLPAVANPQFDQSIMDAYQKSHPEAASVSALFLCSDLPFIRAADIDSFLEEAESDVTLTLGLIDHHSLQRLQSALGAFATLETLKLGALLLREHAVRISNLFLVRPLCADPVLYECLRDLYAHRNLLTSDGGVNWQNWWAIGRSILRHTRRVRRRLRFVRGLIGLVTAIVALTLARSAYRVSRFLSKPFRFLIGTHDIEFILSLLTDTSIRLNVNPRLSPAIDIDVEESYQTLASHGEKNFQEVVRYIERLS
jgi:4-diphosphocytidyl-2-methyl-D-erithritol synthase